MEQIDTLYISDLDGTLLNSKAELEAEAAYRLNKLIAQGMCFSVATARTYATVDRMLTALNRKYPEVHMNGVMLYDPVERKCMEAVNISKEAVKLCFQVMREFDVTGFIYTIEDGELIPCYEELATPQMQEFHDERVLKYNKYFRKVDSLEVLCQAQVIYMSLLNTEEKLQPVYERLSKCSDLHISYYKDIYAEELWYLEISDANASKENGVKRLIEILSPKRVVGFGDNLNDIPLFEACDVAVAVENARQTVKERADYVTLSNEELGVPAYIEKDFKCIG